MFRGRKGVLQMRNRYKSRLYGIAPGPSPQGGVGRWSLRSDRVPTGWVPRALIAPRTH